MSSEFRRGWPVLLAAATGVGLGIAGLLTYTAGVFGAELQRQIGLSRAGLGAGFFASTLALAAALPLVGRAVDRTGPRRAALVGAALLALGFLALATLVRGTVSFIMAMTVVGLAAAGSSPVAYTRAINEAFVRSRGLALGLTQLGIGVAAVVMPPAIAAIVTAHGWQAGYLVLAGIALLGLFPASRLPGASRSHSDQSAATAPPATFFLMLAAFGTMALSFAGMLPHFVPMLREAGVDLQAAGALAGLIGVAVIVSRVVVGWLADRIPAPWIAAGSCAICAAGCLVLAIGGVGTAWLGALALGSAMGAEADLIGYLTARYFGVGNYGRLYSRQYASFMVLAGASPLWIGALADATGGYRTPLFVAAIGLCTAIVLFLQLPTRQQEAGEPVRP